MPLRGHYKVRWKLSGEALDTSNLGGERDPKGLQFCIDGLPKGRTCRIEVRGPETKVVFSGEIGS